MEFQGVRSYVVTEKLKALKQKLKIWNKDVFGNVHEKKNQALKSLASWDALRLLEAVGTI